MILHTILPEARKEKKEKMLRKIMGSLPFRANFQPFSSLPDFRQAKHLHEDFKTHEIEGCLTEKQKGREKHQENNRGH